MSLPITMTETRVAIRDLARLWELSDSEESTSDEQLEAITELLQVGHIYNLFELAGWTNDVETTAVAIELLLHTIEKINSLNKS